MDMDEEALRRGLLGPSREHAEPVPHARRPKPLDGEPHLDRLRIGQRAGVAAAGLDDEADRIAALDVEQPGFDQPGVHRRVEPLVIDRVVDVAVGVVVRPARAALAPGAIGFPASQGRSAQSAAS